MSKRLNPVQPIMLVVKIILFLLLLGFAAMNSESVMLRYFLGLSWQAPLSLVLLVTFAAGLVMGLLGCSMRLLRSHREIRTLQRQLEAQPISMPVPTPVSHSTPQPLPQATKPT